MSPFKSVNTGYQRAAGLACQIQRAANMKKAVQTVALFTG